MRIDEVERRLREAGNAPVPKPRAAFTEALQDRLRSGALVPVPASLSRPVRRRHHPWAVGVVAAAAVVTTVFAAATPVFSPATEREVRFAAATDALVVLPDGTVEEAAPGVVVPDGTRILTGDEGRVVAGDVEVGPNREAVVSEGTVRTTPTTIPVPPSPSTSPTATSPSTTVPPSPRIHPAPAPPPTAPPTATQDREERKPAAAPATKPTSEARPKPNASTTSTTSTATAGPAVHPQPLELAARYKDTTVSLKWSRYSGSDFAAYLVLRSDGPAEPRYPLDASTTVVARIDNPASTRFFDRAGDPTRQVYRVVAVDEQRRLLAQSPAVHP